MGPGRRGGHASVAREHAQHTPIPFFLFFLFLTSPRQRDDLGDMPPAPVRSLSAARVDSSSLSLGAPGEAGPSDRRLIVPIEKTGDAARLVQWTLDNVYKGEVSGARACGCGCVCGVSECQCVCAPAQGTMAARLLMGWQGVAGRVSVARRARREGGLSHIWRDRQRFFFLSPSLSLIFFLREKNTRVTRAR